MLAQRIHREESRPVDSPVVAQAVEEVASLLRSDGADLRVVRVDPKTARIELALDLESAECAECVVAPALLREMVESALARRLQEEFELVLDDVRDVDRGR